MGIGILEADRSVRGQPEPPASAILDARPHDQFQAGHIPGATWLGWEGWCESAPDSAGPVLAQGGYWGVMTTASAPLLGRRLAAQGLCGDRPIVVYADGPRSRGREGRVAWMLLYLGAPTVYLLDGGWSGWLAHGGKAPIGTPSPATDHFTARFQPERRQTLRALRACYRAATLPVLVDTRSQSEFDGEIQEYLPRRGHLPGALLLPFTSLFAPDGRYIPREQYLSRLPEGARQATSLVSYCEVAVRASLFALLHETYTGQIVAVYDGSVMQWFLEHDLPMENARS
ncbi:MAG TPA: rhodanese-like domain-containing protein [Chloroflexota bacterium]|nr:rhodanese-like domain-containing protein [Chloroflexota bacterium]